MSSHAEDRLDVERVFEDWRKRRPNPALVRLTLDRERTIRGRLRLGYTPDDLILVISFIYESDSDDARWMRGEHPRNRRQYLDLENILRIQRLGERVEAAKLWKSGQGQRSVSSETSADPFRFTMPSRAPDATIEATGRMTAGTPAPGGMKLKRKES